MLIGLAALIGLGLWNAPQPLVLGKTAEDSGKARDVDLYMAEIRRIHAGESYYQAAATELPARGYPTASVFNWRTPLPMWLIGKLPNLLWGQLILAAAVLATLLLAYLAAAKEQPNHYRLAVPLVVLLSWMMIPYLQSDCFMLHEIWAGVLIALSLAAYGTRRRLLGAAMGLAALLIRDLALPYCLLGLGLALVQRRPKESIVWIAGLVGWAILYGLHCWQASQWITPTAMAHPHGWVRFGGLTFVLATTQTNAVLGAMPVWVTVLAFALAVVGFADWQTDWAARIGLTAAMYAVAFSIVGQQFNTYWGLMTAPLFCFGAARGPADLSDLWRAAKLGKRKKEIADGKKTCPMTNE